MVRKFKVVEENFGNEQEASETKVSKSIVPSRYGTKYKNGGSDELARFINAQCKDNDGKFNYSAFFDLAAQNGVDVAEIKKYASQIEENRHGSQGRARMTLRNRIETSVRKNGHAVGLDGRTHSIELSPKAVSGAAAARRAAKAEAQETA